MKAAFYKLMLMCSFLLCVSSCSEFDELEQNPNVASEDKAIPPSYLLGRILFDMYQGGGVTDARPGSVFEGPWGDIHRWNQYVVSNNIVYGGKNSYYWTTSATPYAVITNIDKMEAQAFKLLGQEQNAFSAIGKFLKAYHFIWFTQRVGDIPMTQAATGLDNLTPEYDTQKEVYSQCLVLLEEANNDLSTLIPLTATASSLSGDIYFNNDLKLWQKAVNTFTLRVLISLSKRADDTPELKIKEKFASIITNPSTYPLMTGNADNLNFTFNTSNAYPRQPTNGNNNYQNIGSTYLDMTTSSKDPRTFIVATPAPAELAAGKTMDDFTAYVGSKISDGIDQLSNNSTSGKYSFTNYLRYYSSTVGPEPYTLIGFAEMNFNIAEAIVRGWIPGADPSIYYTKGIAASLDFYGLKEGDSYKIGDLAGKPLGTVTIKIAEFFANPNIVFKGANEDGLEQILNQKYIAFFENSGLEAFYNQRRTGFPRAFITTGSALNAEGKVPKRWQYPLDEQVYNADHYHDAIQRQFNGKDDLYSDMWLLQ